MSEMSIGSSLVGAIIMFLLLRLYESFRDKKKSQDEDIKENTKAITALTLTVTKLETILESFNHKFDRMVTIENMTVAAHRRLDEKYGPSQK
jgi:hypothetical protein